MKNDIAFSLHDIRLKARLNNISLTVFNGETIALVGANGSGKSTLLKLILGFIRPSSGTITHKNNCTFGYVPENASVPSFLTISQYLQIITKQPQRTVIEKLLSDLNLTPFSHQPMKYFSKGMRQRAMIAQALIDDPDILILDEPFSGLDKESQNIINAIIERQKANIKTIVYSTHETPLSSTDKIVILENKTIHRIILSPLNVEAS